MRPPEDSDGPLWYAEKLEALTDPAHEYHEEALDALGDDNVSHAQPNIAVIHARFAALAKKWAPRPWKPNLAYVNAASRPLLRYSCECRHACLRSAPRCFAYSRCDTST